MDANLTFSQAVFGHRLTMLGRGLSQHTIDDYQNAYKKLTQFLQIDPPFGSIDRELIEMFLINQPVSNKTRLNYVIALSALWTWAVNGNLVAGNVIKSIVPPKPEKRVINPFTEADLRSMLKSLVKSKAYSRPGKCKSDHSLPNSDRNRCIILLLLDTGLRAEELASLRIHQIDFKNLRIKIFGKGSKERIVPFSPRTAETIWRYIAPRKNQSVGENLFVTSLGRSMTRDRLYKTIVNIGSRAGVQDAHPHRFRHTFAINYLRNGGDPWSLQMILGHSTMDMVKTYLGIAQSDLDANHRRASPVENWRL